MQKLHKIIAVVVTHNRKNLLRRVVESIANQTCAPEKIFIINNCSTDGTEEMLRCEGLLNNRAIELISLLENLGGAGGFNLGIHKAYEDGADWVWVMDDDCMPQPDCLERLLIAEEHLRTSLCGDIGFLASRVMWTDGTPCLMNLPIPHPLWIEPHARTFNLARLSASSFVSMLISRRAIAKNGLPVKEFFIWFDDSEYSRRISEGMRCYLVSDSVVIHETAKNVAALDFSQLDGNSLWRFSYGIRNEASFHFEKEGFSAGLFFCLKMLSRAMRHAQNWSLRISVAKACWSGFRFRYTRFIEYI